MLIEVRPGEGGDDAEAFADELFDALMARARMDGPVKITERSPRMRSFELHAPGTTLVALAGNHRVQRIPKGSASRHTSTATVAVLDVETAKV